jgi:hypothetical protein
LVPTAASILKIPKVVFEPADKSGPTGYSVRLVSVEHLQQPGDLFRVAETFNLSANSTRHSATPKHRHYGVPRPEAENLPKKLLAEVIVPGRFRGILSADSPPTGGPNF